jgi:hypothetical protein
VSQNDCEIWPENVYANEGHDQAEACEEKQLSPVVCCNRAAQML